MTPAIRHPLTLLYDAACPVCSLEMDHLRERDREGRLRFVDIAAPGFDASPYGTSLEALDAALHAIDADGRRLVGVPALEAAYAAVGLGWLWAPARWPLFAPLAATGYRHFARHRRRISQALAPAIDGLRRRRAERAHDRIERCTAAGRGACVDDHPRSTR